MFSFLSAQWDAINEMDEYFTPIHTYQVSNVQGFIGKEVENITLI